MISKFFSRALQGLRAAHLNQQLVVTGGNDNEGNKRDEVLCGIYKLVVFTDQNLKIGHFSSFANICLVLHTWE